MDLLKKIAEFMRQNVEHNARHASDLQSLREENRSMAATLKSVLDKLTAQGAQIDQLAAQKTASEQADLDAIDAAIDANGVKVTAALTPAADAGTGTTG